MKEYLSKKTIAEYIEALAAFIALVLLFAYRLFATPYGIFNSTAFTCLLLAAIADIVLIAYKTKYDSYIQILAVVLSTLALSWFIADCSGTINDYINHVVFMGSGAPIKGIVYISIFMALVVISNITSSFFERFKGES
ncbi:MAG: hypothetical protein LBT59_15070 [Clostridiales bacterium]|nr:hypothetical protein [Clostridiales bacterium]